jgi:hypothetical protein
LRIFADVILWLLAAAAPAAYAAPFAFTARHRTPGKIAAAIYVSSAVTTVLACIAWRLR